MRYAKVALTFEEQLELLQQRGMHIEDASRASHHLERIGYYRLMGYFYPFRRPDSDDYVAGASFDRSLHLYEFDRALRALVLDAVSHIEVTVRTAITYEMGHTYGAFGYCDATSVAWDEEWHGEWLADIEKEVRRANERFIEHYKRKYDGYPRLPIWMATEVMSLGTMSKWVKAMHPADKKRIATRFGFRAPAFESLLHSVVVVRNICAHHGRFWNRVLGVKPKRPETGEWMYMADYWPSDRAFYMLVALRQLLASTAADAVEWRDRVAMHIAPLVKDDNNRLSMGAIKGWENLPLWVGKR